MNGIIILFPILFPVLFGLLLPVWTRKKGLKLRRGAAIAAAAIQLGLVCAAAAAGPGAFTAYEFLDGVPLSFRTDGLGLMFAVLLSVMWLCSAVYSYAYMGHESEEGRYYTFFLLAEGALTGVCFAGNLVTMYLFYEMMTLSTFPLVLHNRLRESVAAGIKYLFYSMGGAFLSLSGILFLSACSDTLSFAPGGVLNSALTQGREGLVLLFVFFVIIGFGSKAGMFPLHGWLPDAHPAAPAPASALLSGNITKIGVLAIIRVLFYYVGPDMVRGTWVQYAFMALSLLTVFLGSMLSFKEQILKKRLAYSTISQVSYILFGISCLNGTAFAGALMHVVFHSVAKNVLFLTSGAILFRTGKRRVEELTGIGKQMPITMWCFLLSSLTLIGIPPASAFLSKWYLAEGALSAGLPFVSWFGPLCLLISALLTAGYLLPVAMKAFFPGEEFRYEEAKRAEAPAAMWIPMVALSAAAILFGMFPGGLVTLINRIVEVMF